MIALSPLVLASPAMAQFGGNFGDIWGGSITPPKVTISASPTSITSGKISMVTWSSTNATSCTASGSWTGRKATSGTLAVSPTSTATYTLTCTGVGGTSAAASTTVMVTAAPVAVNGACGSANGTTASSTPSANLCSTGTSSSVAGSGPWTWSCGGSNGGTTASCSASVTVAGGGGSTPPSAGGSTPPTTPTPASGNCGMQWGGGAIFCETMENNK